VYNFGDSRPVTAEIARKTIARFWTRRQKSAYPTEYLSNYWTDLCQPFSKVGLC